MYAIYDDINGITRNTKILTFSQNFIQSQVNYSYWVGLHKKGSQFQWVHHKDAKLSSDL